MDRKLYPFVGSSTSWTSLVSSKPTHRPAAPTASLVSPVDHHVGQTVKRIIAHEYEAAFDANEEMWLLPKKEGGLGDMKKRLLVAEWVSKA